MEAASEECEDENILNGDGCSDSCVIEAGYICSGGSFTTIDTCSSCGDGVSPNVAKDTCVVSCGDGKVDTTEECDDSNNSNGDGCSSACLIESNSVCSGGSLSSPNTCEVCQNGSSPNIAEDACITVCGDGIKAASEECEDGGIVNGDGCSDSCTIEADFACSGGSYTTLDTCQLCGDGVSPNSAQDACIVVCGDGKVDTTEECDDANNSNGDGCSSACLIESPFICNGGSPSTQDTCQTCMAGLSPNSAKNACVSVCGDSMIYGFEQCDDGNTTPGDGCSEL